MRDVFVWVVDYINHGDMAAPLGVAMGSVMVYAFAQAVFGW